MMKRFLFLLSLILLVSNTNLAYAVTSDKAEIKAIKNVLKQQVQSANKYSYPDFIKFFDCSYINSDGFNLDIYSKLVEDTWTSYSNIQYAQKVKNVSVYGNDAIAEVLETANAQIKSEYDLSGHLKSIANNVYYLKKTDDGWKIVSDLVLTEDTYLSFGELIGKTPVLSVPYQVLANQNFTASLSFETPKNTIAIASINQEKVTFPQQSSKENYRKLPDDGILERFFTSNGDGVNEYIVASIGLTRPEFENKDLQISVTGIAYIIKRINVIPENKYIEKDGLITVSERLLRLKKDEADVELKDVQTSSEEVKKEIKKKNNNKEEVKNSSTSDKEVKINNTKDESNTEVKKTEEKATKVKTKEENKDKKMAPEKMKKEEKTISEPGQKAKNSQKNIKKDKTKKSDKKLKGTYSPEPVGIDTTMTVSPIEDKPADSVDIK